MRDERPCRSARLVIAAWGGETSLRRFMESHIQTCEECAAIAGALDTLIDHFVDDDDVYREIAQVIEERLASERPHRWEWLARSETEFHHRIVIAHLIERSDQCYPANPSDGLCYAEAAVGAFEAMMKRRPPEIAADALLYATALKNCATHQYVLGHYSKALCAADASANAVAAFADGEGVLAHRGAIALARGMIYGDIDVCEYNKALAEVDDAESLFAVSNPQRVADARSMRSIIFVRSGRRDEARRLLRELLSETQHGSTKRGMTLQYLAWCAVLDGDVESALTYAREALVIHTAQQNRVDQARAEWVIGRALSMQGKHESARTMFGTASAVFSESDLQDVWVRVRLDYVYDMLTENPSADVRVMCESIAAVSHALDQREPLRRHHCTAEALAYLRTSAASNSLTPDNVAYVIRYLDQLTTRPPVRFTPPHPDFVM